jgi:hypothetical protein
MAHYNFGEVLQQMGELTDAVAQFRIALELRSDFAPARRALDKLTADAQRTENQQPLTVIRR